MGELTSRHVILRLIIKFMVVSMIFQFGLWLIIWLQAIMIMNEHMDFIVGKVTEMNCLDAATGEYDLVTERLLRTNNSKQFMKYPINIVNYAEVSTKEGDDFIRYKINDVTRNGDDGFTVTHSGGTAYSYANAPQQYDPLEVQLTATIYLPMLVYIGREFADDATVNSEGGMRWTSLPAKSTTPCLAVTLVRKETVVGTKFFKGQSIG